MVYQTYNDIDEAYRRVRVAHAAGQVAQSVMILVAAEVDAMASARILTQLLREDNIVYGMHPVTNYDHIKAEIPKFPSTIRSVFMINCGASWNIPKLFRLDQADVDYRIYVLDNHRPFHLANIYSRSTTLFLDETERSDVENAPEEGDGDDLSETGPEGEEDDDDEDRDELEEEGDFGDESDLDEDEEAEFEEEGRGEGDEEEAEEDEEGEGEAEAEDGGDDASKASKSSISSKASKALDAHAPEGEGEGEGEQPQQDANAEAEAGTEAEAEAEAGAEAGTGGLASPVSRKAAAKSTPSPSSSSKPRGASSSPTARAGSSSPSTVSSSSKRRRGEGEAGAEGEEGEGEEGEGEEGEGERRGSSSRGREGRDDEDQAPRGFDDDGFGFGGAGAEEEDDEESVVVGRKRRRERRIDPKILRRQQILEYYGRLHTYSAPTSFSLMHLVLGRTGTHVPLDHLWQAVLGVCDQHQRLRVSDEAYQHFCSHIKDHLSLHIDESRERGRYMVTDSDPNGGHDTQTLVQGQQAGNITEGAELNLFLYRHWSLYESMSYSPYMAAKLGLWQPQGAERLKQMLAKVGVPLQQCKQTYTYMAPSLKDHLKQRLLDDVVTREFRLEDPALHVRSFYRFNSYRNPVASIDVALAAQALVESFSLDGLLDGADKGLAGENGLNGASSLSSSSSSSSSSSAVASRVTAFFDAYDSLGMKQEATLKRGLDTAISIQKMVVSRAKVLLDGGDAMTKLRHLYWAKVNPSSREAHGTRADMAVKGASSPFERPMVLQRLGQYIMGVKLNLAKKDGGWIDAHAQQSNVLPLIVTFESESRDRALVVGISPLDNNLGSLTSAEVLALKREKLMRFTSFKQLFSTAARDCSANCRFVSFDTNAVEIDTQDVDVFVQTIDLHLTNDERRRAAGRI